MMFKGGRLHGTLSGHFVHGQVYLSNGRHEAKPGTTERDGNGNGLELKFPEATHGWCVTGRQAGRQVIFTWLTG